MCKFRSTFKVNEQTKVRATAAAAASRRRMRKTKWKKWMDDRERQQC